MEIDTILSELKKDLDQTNTAITALRGLPSGRESKKVLEELESNRTVTEDAVVALANLERSRGKRRGRRPGWIEAIIQSKTAS